MGERDLELDRRGRGERERDLRWLDRAGDRCRDRPLVLMDRFRAGLFDRCAGLLVCFLSVGDFDRLLGLLDRGRVGGGGLFERFLEGVRDRGLVGGAGLFDRFREGVRDRCLTGLFDRARVGLLVSRFFSTGLFVPVLVVGLLGLFVVGLLVAFRLSTLRDLDLARNRPSGLGLERDRNLGDRDRESPRLDDLE